LSSFASSWDSSFSDDSLPFTSFAAASGCVEFLPFASFNAALAGCLSYGLAALACGYYCYYCNCGLAGSY